MSVNGKMESVMARVNTLIKMVLFMKVAGKITKKTGMEHIQTFPAGHIQANGKMVCVMEKENSLIKTPHTMMVTG